MIFENDLKMIFKRSLKQPLKTILENDPWNDLQPRVN